MLIDILFSPLSDRWDPFIHNLDLRRSIAHDILKAVREAAQRCHTQSHAVAVVAPSASGKTTILKRVALDLADDNHLVFWLRPYYYQDAHNQFRRFLDCIKQLGAKDKLLANRTLIFFIDDPIRMPNLRLRDIKSHLEEAGLSAALVVGTRATDQELLDSDLTFGGPVQLREIFLPDEFDAEELESLPAFLAQLGVTRNLQDAEQLVATSASNKTTDVLSTLFALVPDTRSSIVESVRDEYFRLGDRKHFTEVIIGSVNQTSAMLKDAYALVACGERNAGSVPIEVLVGALGTSYFDWLSAAPDDTLHWGLLYADQDESAESVVYQTRNETVCDIIVRQVNGGQLGRNAEFENLKRLIRACDGHAPAYRQFVHRVLIPSQPSRLNEFEPTQIDQLFSEAVNALPHEDPVLLHHQGLWQRKRLRDPARAEETLRRALAAKPFPYSDRTEASEHIYTSLAANARDKIRSGIISQDEGIAEALSHLDHARSAKFVNANATHVQAGLIANLASLRARDHDPDFFALVERALGDIDRMLLIVQSVFADPALVRHERDMLESKRDDLLDQVMSDAELAEIGRQQWEEQRRLDALIIFGRRLLRNAKRSNRGRDYNLAWKHCESLLNQAGEYEVPVPPALAELLLQIAVIWQLKRRQSSVGTSSPSLPIDWSQLRALCSLVLESNTRRNDPLYLYLEAVADAHLGDWESANATFGTIRRLGLQRQVLHEPRDFLIAENGGPRRVEGRLQLGPSGRLFLRSDELGTDMPAGAFRGRSRDGDAVNAYVRLCFAGPEATPDP